MRMSELAQISGISVPSIKYYLREGLLPEGRRTAATQADYGDAHVRRLGVIRALLDTGVGVSDARRVLQAIDDPPANPHDLLGAAHSAIQPARRGDLDLAPAKALAQRIGWREGLCQDDLIAGIADALHTLQRAGFDVPDAVMSAHLEAVAGIAAAEIEGVPTTSAEDAVRYVVLGTVLMEPLLLALRRLAEQLESGRRFGVGAVPDAERGSG